MKFTANAIYLQTLAVQAAQAVKVAVQKAQPEDLVTAEVMKEVENVVASAEASRADEKNAASAARIPAMTGSPSS